MNNFNINTHRFCAIVIGSGCAGLNAADCLCEDGYAPGEIALITEGMKMGTSRNTGSDKQTYYKIALASDSHDGVLDMAKTYFSGRAMNGDTALTESANSLKCFYKLASLGVPFPRNEYGEYVGYKTDHDGDCKRATSAGPYTSKFMTEALEKSVTSKGIPIFDGVCIFKLFKDTDGICAALGYNGVTGEFELFYARTVILATGGCAYLYRDRVFPRSQSGMSGLAYELGAKSANLCEWQYGLASVDVPWNVSGTYQQVLPRYVSVDRDGNVREFLAEHFGDPMKACELVFLKGYQWPFDSAKINSSSLVDILVHKEVCEGKSVYLDFMHNPTGLDFEKLSPEAHDYLEKSGALFGTPFERLRAMNKKAISLYLDKGIDLEKEMLKIAVCAQHQNGGIYVDTNYETTIPGLYAAGEAAGVFGIYRPGGSALNSTQVSSMRAAEHSARVRRDKKLYECENDIFALAQKEVSAISDLVCKSKSDSSKNAFLDSVEQKIKGDMSNFAGFMRNKEKIQELYEFARRCLDGFNDKVGSISDAEIIRALKVRDMLICACETLCAMLLWCEKIGFRGGAILSDFALGNARPVAGSNGIANAIVCTQNGVATFEEPREIPMSNTWFESIYNKTE